MNKPKSPNESATTDTHWACACVKRDNKGRKSFYVLQFERLATGFNRGQIDYRLRLAGVRVRSYRNGRTPIARFVMLHSRNVAEKHIMKQLS